jgi:hypothetical protein
MHKIYKEIAKAHGRENHIDRRNPVSASYKEHGQLYSKVFLKIWSLDQ